MESSKLLIVREGSNEPKVLDLTGVEFDGSTSGPLGSCAATLEMKLPDGTGIFFSESILD